MMFFYRRLNCNIFPIPQRTLHGAAGIPLSITWKEKLFKRKYKETEKTPTLPQSSHRQPINQPSKRLLRLTDKRLPLGTVAAQSWLLIVADICWKEILCFLSRKEEWVESHWDDPREWWAVQGLRGWRKLGTSLVPGIFWVSLRITARNSCRALFPLAGQMWVVEGDLSPAQHIYQPQSQQTLWVEGGWIYLCICALCLLLFVSALFQYCDIIGEGLFPWSLLMTDTWQVSRLAVIQLYDGRFPKSHPEMSHISLRKRYIHTIEFLFPKV